MEPHELSELLGRAFADAPSRGTGLHAGTRRRRLATRPALLVAGALLFAAVGAGVILHSADSGPQGVSVGTNQGSVYQRRTADGVLIDVRPIDGGGLEVHLSVDDVHGVVTTASASGAIPEPVFTLAGGTVGDADGSNASVVVLSVVDQVVTTHASFPNGGADEAPVVDGWSVVAHRGLMTGVDIEGRSQDGVVLGTVALPTLRDEVPDVQGEVPLFWRQSREGLAIRGFQVVPEGATLGFFVPEILDGPGVAYQPHRDFFVEGVPFCAPLPSDALFAFAGPSGETGLAHSVPVYTGSAVERVQLRVDGQIVDSMSPVFGHAVLTSRSELPPSSSVEAIGSNGELQETMPVGPSPELLQCDAVG